MAEASNVPSVEEPKIENQTPEQEKVDDAQVLSKFQTRLHERRSQSTRTARNFKDIIKDLWSERKCYDSPFPRRESNSYAGWFVDGEGYMEHAANMISLAKEEIFITDWWLSPQVYLKRPTNTGKWRFDVLLKRKAEEGVKIYIQLFKELEMALGTIKSLESKKILHSLHPNIKVIRHPDRISGVLFWSHHEKLLIIDQNIAYVGGIDFAFGRWDTNKHRLADLGPVELLTTEPRLKMTVIEGGMEEPQTSLNDMEEPSDEQQPVSTANGLDLVEPSNYPYSYINDVSNVEYCDEDALGQGEDMVDQENVQNAADSEIHDGNMCQHLKKRVTWSEDNGEAAEQEGATPAETLEQEDDAEENHQKFGKITRALRHVKEMYHRHKEKKHLRYDENIYYEEGWAELTTEDLHRKNSAPLNAKMFIGKDYVNFIEKNFVELDKPEHDFIDRNETPRMPWHDIHAVVYGAPARDLAEHFISRWKATKATKKKLACWPELILKKMDFHVPQFLRRMSFPCRIQVLRSACDWSVPGLQEPEDSIHQAYLHMIGNAKHYIYIENQFFISLMASEDVTNYVCHALCDRIVRAYEEQEPLKVYIVVPLLPNFEGKVGEESGSSLLAVMRWTYDSLCREPHSLFYNLKKRGVSNPSQFVSVCSLRTYDKLPEKLVTELIYIHSKLIIVDDKEALIGSANINDRSQLGTRDSEIAIHIQDLTSEPAKMHGHTYKAGQFCSSLRRHIFAEHLGSLDTSEPLDQEKHIPVDVSDPTTDEFFEGTWKKIAEKNTEIFELAFRCIPTNSVSTFEELTEYKEQPTLAELDEAEAAALLRQVQGHLVEFPMAFLCGTDLAPSITTKEGLVPYQIFT